MPIDNTSSSVVRDRRAVPVASALLLIGAFAVASCGGPDRAGKSAALTGNLVLAPGQVLPAGMPIEVQLVPVKQPGEVATPLASTQVEWSGGSETPFSLEYAAARAGTGSHYLLVAQAALNDRTFLSGKALAPVPAVEPDIPVDIVLRRPEGASPLYLDVSVLQLEHKRDSDWAHSLREMMPAIQICLHSVSGNDITVTKAWPAGGGRIGVRIRGRDGSGFDCRALPDGSKFESLSGLPSFAEKLPGEGEPTFVPAPGSPKMDKCLRYERVLGGLGETLGWLVYRTCPQDAATPGQGPAAAPAAQQPAN